VKNCSVRLYLFFIIAFSMLCSISCRARSKNVAVIGTGYVGLIVGSSLADMGNTIICADIDREKISKLSNLQMPIYEPGLKELVAKNIDRISFTIDVQDAIKKSEIIIVAVGTPTLKNYKSDLRALHAVARTIGQALQGEDCYKVVCIKSTVPVGTNKQIKKILSQYIGDDSKFDLVSNPEFLRAGAALSDLYKKNPVILGSDSEKALDIMAELYSPLVESGITLIRANDFATAEMAKYAWNSLVALKVSYANDLSRFCDSCGADVFKVIQTIGFNDAVLPFKNVKPGPGLGGSCLPKDTRAFVKMADDQEVDFSIIKAVINSSAIQKKFVVKKLYDLLGESVEGKIISVLGLAFKANTDDIRKSPAIIVIDELLQDGAIIKAYDPKATENMRQLFPEVKYCDSAYEAVEGADAMIALTSWEDIKNIDLAKVHELMNGNIIVDGRNMFDPGEFVRYGFEFANLGRR